MKIVLNFAALAVIVGFGVVEALAGPVRVAILGDSISTGAASHPALTYDNVSLWSIFRGETSVAPTVHGESLTRFGITGLPESPRVLKRSIREYTGGTDWVFINLISLLSQRFLNTEEYSWGYMVGRALGANPKDIVIAAENGARAEHMVFQADRLLNALAGNLPEKIFVFFTGNDLCAERAELTTSSGEFGQNLSLGLSYLARNGVPAPGGTDIYVVGYLGILQLLTNPELLDKPITAFGQPTTCRGLRASGYAAGPTLPERAGSSPEALMFGNIMPPSPARMCPTLFGQPDRVAENLTEYGNRIRNFRHQAKELIDAVSSVTLRRQAQTMVSNQEGLRFHYLSAAEGINFRPLDIAGDCFHLTYEGQGVLADRILAELSGSSPNP